MSLQGRGRVNPLSKFVAGKRPLSESKLDLDDANWMATSTVGFWPKAANASTNRYELPGLCWSSSLVLLVIGRGDPDELLGVHSIDEARLFATLPEVATIVAAPAPKSVS